ncbi:MAG: hypothetical protein JNM47_12060 [Hyphomonadaceae bacterium]|nr:hypothetical protein [Hyphomonadaceae bacterium]
MSLLALVLVLLCVGALLHVAWLLALALMVWVPSGYVGILCGWYAAQLLESTSAGVAVAVAVAALTRFAILRFAACLFPLRLIAIVASEV